MLAAGVTGEDNGKVTTATEAIGPVVRMFGNPQCGGLNACDRIRRDAFMGLTEVLDPAMGVPDDAVCALLCQALAFNYAADSAGVQRMIPDGCEFTVHKNARADWDGRLRYTAVYSGTAPDKDAALGGPEWGGDAAAERVKRMRAAGVFDAVDRWRAERG